MGRSNVKDMRKKLKSYSKKASANPKLAAARNVPTRVRKTAVYSVDLAVKESPVIGSNTGMMDVVPCNTGAPATYFNMYHLNRVPLQEGNSGRRDKSIIAKSVQIRGNLSVGPSYGSGKCVSVALVWDREREERTQSAFTIGKILNDGNYAGFVSSNSLTNLDGAARFKILRRLDFPNNGVNVADGQIYFDMFVRLKDRECSWDAANLTGDAVTARKGVLCLLIWSSHSPATADPILATFVSRFYYTDA